MSEQLQLTVTIDEDNLGSLISAALKLNAKIDALGLIESVPYHKNTPRLVPLQLEAPAKGQKTGQRKLKAREDPVEFSKHKLRKQNAFAAVEAAIRAAGPENGLPVPEGLQVYMKAGGNAQGFGPVWRNAWRKHRDRLFLRSYKEKGD